MTMKHPQDNNQLSLFKDEHKELIRRLADELLKAGPKLERMVELQQKVLLGQPGYAKPEYIKKIRAHRKVLRLLIGAVVAKASVDWVSVA